MSGYRGAVAGLAVVLVAAIGVATGGSAQGGVVLDPTSITIYHDRHGVPQIEAGSADALAYGTGYEQAKERPFLTNGIRLFAQGRISELEGKDVLPADEAVRRDFYDAADVQRQYNLLPAGIKRELQAFSDGFNKGMQEVNQAAATQQQLVKEFEDTCLVLVHDANRSRRELEELAGRIDRECGVEMQKSEGAELRVPGHRGG